MPTHLGYGEGRCRVGRNESMHHWDSRGKGPGIRGKICGDNAGKLRHERRRQVRKNPNLCVTARRMKDGPSESACRSRLQTTSSCCGQKPWRPGVDFLSYGRNDLGGEQTRRPEHQELPAAPKTNACMKSFCRNIMRSADPLRLWGRPMPRGKKRARAP